MNVGLVDGSARAPRPKEGRFGRVADPCTGLGTVSELTEVLAASRLARLVLFASRAGACGRVRVTGIGRRKGFGARLVSGVVSGFGWRRGFVLVSGRPTKRQEGRS